jgi:predicted Zn-dependent protease
MSIKYSLQLLTPLALSILIASNSVALADPSFGVSKKELIHQTLYKIYRQQQNADAMRTEVTAILALNPNNTFIQQDYAQQLFLAHRYKDAIPYFLKVTKSLPMSAESWASLGDCYMQLNNHGAALKAYTQAVQSQKGGQNFGPRYQQAQQYIQHDQQMRLYNEQQKKQKEDSDD